MICKELVMESPACPPDKLSFANMANKEAEKMIRFPIASSLKPRNKRPSLNPE
jgi:hypothetical protein